VLLDRRPFSVEFVGLGGLDTGFTTFTPSAFANGSSSRGIPTTSPSIFIGEAAGSEEARTLDGVVARTLDDDAGVVGRPLAEEGRCMDPLILVVLEWECVERVERSEADFPAVRALVNFLILEGDRRATGSLVCIS
jgi:hypothetical protein